MSSKTKYWGEFDEPDNREHTNFQHSDYHHLLYPLEPSPSLVKMHQPSPQLTSSFEVLSGDSCRFNPIVQNTIRYVQYNNNVLHLISIAKNVLSSADEVSTASLAPCPPIPAEAPSFRHLTSPNLDDALHIEVRHSIASKIMRQSVSLMLSHQGFTDTSESVLRVITDVLHQFMSQLTILLREHMDAALLVNTQPNIYDVFETTLQDKVGWSINDLLKMYKEKVVDYQTNAKAQASQLHNSYSALLGRVKEQQNRAVQLIQQGPASAGKAPVQSHKLHSWQVVSSKASNNYPNLSAVGANSGPTFVLGSSSGKVAKAVSYPTLVAVSTGGGRNPSSNYPNLTGSNVIDDNTVGVNIQLLPRTPNNR